MPSLDKLKRIKRHKTIPVVLLIREVDALLARMTGTTRLMAELIYDTGRRIGECVTLRVKDIDFDNRSITVWAGKDNKDRSSLLPEALVSELRNHLTKVAQRHKSVCLQENGYTPMPSIGNALLLLSHWAGNSCFHPRLFVPGLIQIIKLDGIVRPEHYERLFNRLQNKPRS